MRKRKWIYRLLLMCMFTSLFVIAQENSPAYKVIINKSNLTDALTKTQITKYFLKKMTKWPNDEKILPIDKTKKHPVREEFSKDVLHRRAHSVEAYWHKRIFSGRGIPPAQVDADSLIANYVARYPAAIGYVAADYDVSKYNVKVLQIIND